MSCILDERNRIMQSLLVQEGSVIVLDEHFYIINVTEDS